MPSVCVTQYDLLWLATALQISRQLSSSQCAQDTFEAGDDGNQARDLLHVMDILHNCAEMLPLPISVLLLRVTTLNSEAFLPWMV